MKVPFIETYRPKEFAEVVGVRDLDRLSNLISNPQEMPNLLFHGPAGVGKTSVAKIIIDKLKPIDVIKLNGSNKEDRNIETISTRITNFGMSMSTQPDKPKIIFIDELDNLTPDAFLALRGVIEKIITNARFIGTCNYINKIPESIQSRFTSIEFKKPKDEEIFVRIRNICDMEGIQITDDVLKELIERGKGDIRTIINNVQHLSANKTKTISALELVKLGDLTAEVFEMLLNKEWTKIRYEIPNRYPDYNKLLIELEEMFFNSNLDVFVKAKITETVSNGIFEMYFSFDKNICFAATCSKIIKEL